MELIKSKYTKAIVVIVLAIMVTACSMLVTGCSEQPSEPDAPLQEEGKEENYESGKESFESKLTRNVVLEQHPILSTALEQVGNVGGEVYWRWSGFEERVQWCACFVSWCANEHGFIDAGAIPNFSSCSNQGEPWFKERDLWRDISYDPEPADLIFFDLNQDGTTDHVSFVVFKEDGVIYTVEGNVKDECKVKQYKEDEPRIYGYAHPLY